MWRLILILIIVYLLSKLIRTLFFLPEKRSDVGGKPNKSKPLDLTNEEVEDIDFEEIEDRPKKK